MNFMSWTEIESFHNIRKYTKAHPEILNGNSAVRYMPKCKIHGTNSAVQVAADGSLAAQSRTGFISPENDNAGFARWVEEHKEDWKSALSEFIFYGEWFGKNIQKGVACSDVQEKSFAIFAARPLNLEDTSLIVEPGELKSMFSSDIPNVYVLPWYNEGLEVGWASSAEELTKHVDLINSWVSAVEENDPWIEEVFGIKGIGEGLVFYPVTDEHKSVTDFNNLTFKAKGEKHKNITKAAPAQLDAALASSVDEFVGMVLTLGRLEQGASFVNGGSEFDIKKTGEFVGWILKDVEKETQDELEASNLTLDQVKKPVMNKAKNWYLAMAKKL